MSKPSSWPLNAKAKRILIPRAVRSELERSVLSRDCFPTAIGFYPDAVRHEMKRLDHDDYLLMFCVAGAGHLKVSGYQGEIRAGDLILLPPGMAHDYGSDPELPWSLFWCHFRGLAAETYYRHIAFRRGSPVIHNINDLSLQSSFYSLLDIAKSGYSATVFIHAANQLKQILTLTERIRQRHDRTESSERLQAVRAYMRENLHRHVDLDELAAVAQLSKYHFSRRYKSMTGYAPLAHFNHIKMEQACVLLDNSALSISEIAFQLGYDDPLYFSRVFRKITGVSPSKYRSV